MFDNPDARLVKGFTPVTSQAPDLTTKRSKVVPNPNEFQNDGFGHNEQRMVGVIWTALFHSCVRESDKRCLGTAVAGSCDVSVVLGWCRRCLHGTPWGSSGSSGDL